MMKRPIAYDVMRLFIGPAFPNPRGIDRIDLAMARHIFRDPKAPNIGILPTPVGVYAYSANEVGRLLRYVDMLWAERASPTDDPQLQRLLNRLEREDEDMPPVLPPPPLLFRDKVRRMLRMLGTTGLVPRRLAGRTAPVNAVYLNIGQLGLAMPSFFDWFTKRPDISRAMMVHDTIPIDYPHLVGEKAPEYHRQMVRTAAEQADCLIFNSADTRRSVKAVIAEMGRACPPALVRSLPLPGAFIDVEEGISALAGTRYFLAVSTVEPRKNFTLLLRVWDRLVKAMGAEAPHLVIVGAPGKGAEEILLPLHANTALMRRVHHVGGMSSPALASLLLGATAMLCPTLAEGFGLPLLEASALGVPAIATDIPAHRELAMDATILLSSDDEEGWVSAILGAPEAVIRRRPAIPLAMTEAAYCADIVNFISDIPARQPI